MKFYQKLLKEQSFEDLIMGNHALVRAMIETNTKVVTSYPGSPTPEIAAAVNTIPKEKRPFYFEFSTNEKVATEVAFGAAINGHLSTVFFKSVGLNVAADSLVQLGLMNLIGGMVIILGDDPGANSSQNEQDNRHFARTAYIPVLEPATPSEAYEMYKYAAEISKKYQVPIFLRMTTHVCHARETIKFSSYSQKVYEWTSKFDAENGPYLPITKAVFPLKKNALVRLEKISQEAENSQFNKIISPNGSKEISGKKLGIISSSMPVLSLKENLAEAELPIDILQINFSYPLPEKTILNFLKSHDEIIVLEELDRIMEAEVKALAFDNKLNCEIFARKDNDDLMKELGPDRTWKILNDYWPDLFPKKEFEIIKPEMEISPRIAQMCPGCGHRSAFHAVKKALKDNDITVGDIGCHSLGFFKPYKMGESLLSMGHSNGTGSGLSINNKDRKVLTFIGDSTFFHAGLPGIINAHYHNHNITLVVMENGTTAMTGHQPHPGSGEISDKISIKKILESIGIGFIKQTDTYRQDILKQYVEEALEYNGFSVVIAKHPCMLKFMRQRRKSDNYKPRHVEINQDKCEKHLECIEDFGCPSFQKEADGTITVNEELCIGDGSCLQTCPVKAIERVKEEK